MTAQCTGQSHLILGIMTIMTWQMMKNYGKYGKSKHEWYEFYECEGPTLRDTEIPRYRAVIWGRMASTWTNESQPPPW